MAAAAPATLTSDSLEVTRSSHLITLRNPTASHKQALSAAAVLLAARAAKKALRMAKSSSKKGMAFEGGEGLDGEDDGEMSEDDEADDLGVAEALMEADMSMDVEEDEVEEKIKVKVKKAKSSLKKSGGGMGMGMQA